MSAMWGWVNVYKDGRMNVGEYSKQKHEPGLIGNVTSYRTVTSNNPPAEVKTVMAMLDFIGELDFLKGGSNKHIYPQYTAYYIYNADLPKDKEDK